MDDAYYSNIFFIWVEELVWETIFSDLEYGATMFDVVSVEGTPLSYVQGYWEISRSIEILIDTYFVWVV